MLPLDVAYVQESAAHDPAIEDINIEAFGPARFTRAAHKIREGGPHDRSLSFVALRAGEVVASVRMTPIAAGKGRALLLGPLAVRPAHKNLGIGRKLLSLAVAAAAKAGHGAVVLVGDQPYYGPLGFSRIARGRLTMPWPVDPERLLGHELLPGALEELQGEIRHADLAPPSQETAIPRA